MEKIRPVYIKFLIVAIAVFVIGVSVALSDLYQKVCSLEHDLIHPEGKCPLKDSCKRR